MTPFITIKHKTVYYTFSLFFKANASGDILTILKKNVKHQNLKHQNLSFTEVSGQRNVSMSQN